MANRAAQDLGLETHFETEVLSWNIDQNKVHNAETELKVPETPIANVVILPPCGPGDYYLHPDTSLTHWLVQQHTKGAVISSACAGAFILAHAGLLSNKVCTTHWGLADIFQKQFPALELQPESILINEGSVITAGGMMSWLDLGLELVSQFSSPAVMRLLGKLLVVDTGPREQRFYRQFIPSFQHGDGSVLKAQHYLADYYSENISNEKLSAVSCLTERTLQRRFLKATGLNPNKYLKRLRVQKACDLLETTTLSFESITYKVGYQDAGVFRKVFIDLIGLTPKAFRSRFSAEPNSIK